MKKTVLEIDLNALEHNFNVISSKLKPSTKFMSVVKAGGYGSDSIEIAKKLESIGIDYCLLYTSPSPRDQRGSRMPSSA